MSVVVASGPYTTSDNLGYEPLKDFVQYVGLQKPHIVIMTGPFIDSEHSNVKDNSMAEPLKNFFDKLLDNLAEISSVRYLFYLFIKLLYYKSHEYEEFRSLTYLVPVLHKSAICGTG